jgi:hypothetical protein
MSDQSETTNHLDNPNRRAILRTAGGVAVGGIAAFDYRYGSFSHH